MTARIRNCGLLVVSVFVGMNCAGTLHATMPFGAAKVGNTSEIQSALDAGGDINEPAAKGETLLTLACRAGQLEMVRFLLAHGADINRANESGNTPVHIAVISKKIEIVRYLIDQGADLEISQKNMIFPIHTAAGDANLEMLQLLIDSGADLDVQDEHEETPLNYAVCEGHLGNVKKLLAAGASLRVSNQRNPVIRASGRNHPEVVAYLINYLKNPPPTVTSMPAGRREPLNAAIIAGDLGAVKKLIQEEKYQSYARMVAAISLADRHGRYEISQMLRKANAKQAEQFARQKDLSEKLMEAIRDEKYKDADGLLYAGADPNYVNKDGEMTLTRAVESPQMVRLLLKYKADPLYLTPTMKRKMPLYEAASRNAYESVKAMLECADISADQLNKTLYYATTGTKSAPLVRELLNRGADPNYGVTDNNTALHIAAAGSDAEVVKLLLAAGAKINAKNSFGKTPADFAAPNSQAEIIAALQAAGAVVPKVKKDNPLFAAATWGNLQHVKQLVTEGHNINDVRLTHFSDGQADRTLLWYVLCYGSDPEIVRYLIEQKVQGEPWLLAELAERPRSFGPHHAALVQLMIDSGYDVNATNGYGQTPLMVASMMDNFQDAGLLLKKGARLDVRDENNRTALDYARREHHSAIAAMLEKAGAK